MNMQKQIYILQDRLNELQKTKQQLMERNQNKQQVNIINNQIKNTKRRIRELERSKNIIFNTVIFENGKVIHNTKLNLIQFIFNDLPNVEIIKHLQFCGFRRYKMTLIWQRIFNEPAVIATKWVLFKIKELERKEVLNVEMELDDYIKHFDTVFSTNLIDTVKNKEFPMIEMAFQNLGEFIYAKNKENRNKSEKMKVILKEIESIKDNKVADIFNKYDEIACEIDFDTKKQLLTFGFCICLEQLKELNMIEIKKN